MFPGNLPVVNLADTDRLNIRIHKFWWITGLVSLCVFLVAQRLLLPLWLQADIDRLNLELQQAKKWARQYQTSISQIPDTPPQQQQHKHSKLSTLLRLLQHDMPDDLRLASIDWPVSLRLEGESKSRDTISPLRTSLMTTGYFSEIILEQIHQNKSIYNFTLLIRFSEDINFSNLGGEAM